MVESMATSNRIDTESPPPTLALTIPQFCDAHNISEAFFYALQKDGKGPRTMAVGRRRLISIEEAKRWRKANTARACRNPARS
jgi:hypothetical protein